jgi:hypothetical protein
MQAHIAKSRLSKLQAVILALALQHGKPIHKTKMVKLVYLVDELFCQHTGYTLTGMEYCWDHYGPNAVSNAIVLEADALVNKTLLHAVDSVSASGTAARTYQAYPLTPDADALPLDFTELEFIGKILRQYGDMSVSAIVAASKATAPFKGAQQYQRLVLRQREGLAVLRKQLEAIPGYQEDLAEDRDNILAGEKAGPWKTWGEMEEEWRHRKTG